MRGKTYYSDSAGKIQIIPSGDPRCVRSDSKDTGYGTCLAVILHQWQMESTTLIQDNSGISEVL